ncbi:DNA-binding protein [Paenibacillus sp. RRE4]|uniref:HIRAN domain-containing protein n=1 Tax=Paenibacillus sp. RRE4 TaxID=2962587 RepID=UPI002880DA89|nr:HIRAN domain-containing protein [Paenibacillus sp. RRE4]MDT0125697.1 DNA-binding protein [Paenibacillus sp. RRE4]
MSNKIFAALMGMENYHGAEVLHVGDTLYLVKDPDNRLDHQAIKVVIPPIGEVGYIVNHAAMVPHGCWTGVGFYDAFYQQTCAKVRFMMKDMVIIELIEIMHVPVSQMDSIITEWQFREKA